jgi:hypothetical protein
MEFCPGIYEHAAAAIGRSPWEVSRSRDLLAEAHRAAWKLYQHRMIVTGIDVYNVEPEALGAVVGKPCGNNVPAISQHPFDELEELLDLPEAATETGRYADVLHASAELAAACPAAEVRVPVCGPMAFANGLLGMENLLIGLMEDPRLAADALGMLLKHQIGFLEAIQAAGVRPIFFESGATPPLLPVALFEKFEAPLLARLFDACEALFGERPPCIIGGDAAPVAAMFLATRPGYVIAPSETDQRAFLKAAEAHPEVHVRVNLPATLLGGNDFAPIEAAARAAAQIARTRENTSLGCGVVPYETPPEIILRLRELILSL